MLTGSPALARHRSRGSGRALISKRPSKVAGGFTGRVIGMYAAAGTVHFDWFD
ncbi:hypothetical protein [Streptomyces sp. NBC_00847]|nr:hypothetical protein [Streptomyces sp. NBC_00847]MCX4879072.1 hypothetical protein [Streptomyces sp. NBC_00847]